MKGVFTIPSAWLNNVVKVMVVGCGGTGSELVDGLARLHVVLKALNHPGLSISLFDDDTVSAANVGRQRFLPTDIGRHKATVLAERYNYAYGMNIAAHVRQIHKVQELPGIGYRNEGPRLLITCVDKAKARLSIAKSAEGVAHAVGEGDLWCDLGNGKTDGQVVLGHLVAPQNKKALKLPNVADLFGAGLAATDDRAEPSCSVEESLRSQALGINRLMADFAVFALIAPLFTNGSTDFHGGFVDMGKGRMTPLFIDTDAWAFMGYKGSIPKSAAPVVVKKAA